MKTDVETYIAQVTQGLFPAERKRVQQELRSDLTRLIDDLRLAGHDQTEATRQALALFGKPEPVALSMFQVHTWPKFRPLVQTSMFIMALCTLMYSMRISAALGGPALGTAYGCDTPRQGAVCLPSRDGWIAVTDVKQALERAGWNVQPGRVTEPAMPGVANEVLQVRSGTLSLDVPAGPDRLFEARMNRSGNGGRRDPNILEQDGQTFIRGSALFELLAIQDSRVKVNQYPQKSVLDIDRLHIEFPYKTVDPAGDHLWRRVGLSLYRTHRLTVAAQSQPTGVQYPISLKVPHSGSVVLVFRHPSRYGAGYVIAKADQQGVIHTNLPIPVKTVTGTVKRAWWQTQTVSIIQLDEKIKLDQILTPGQVVLLPHS